MENIKLVRPQYQIINDVRIPVHFPKKCVQEAMNYEPKSDDVIIDTYPKSGTTWMQNIVLYLFRKGQELEDYSLFFRMCPFIDAFGQESVNRMPRPGAFKTHLPHNKMTYSSMAKYIYVLRNPKDCCVSLYYHTKNKREYEFWDATFDDFFELFMSGEVEYNDYFDHLDSWANFRDNSQVFFTTYEDMKKDTENIVIKVAKFLGKEYIEAVERDNNVLRNILHFCSFEYMKKHVSELYDYSKVSDEDLNSADMLEGKKHMFLYARALKPPDWVKLEFVRKGKVGDWKGHLSKDQSLRLSEKFTERSFGTDIYDMYKDYIF